MLANPAEFFRHVRTELFAGSMTPSQVSGANDVIAAWPAKTDIRWLAYGLATAYHETDRAMEPVAEYGKGQGRPYGVPCGPYQQRYYGRGYIQLTWLYNYARAEKEIPGSELMRMPDNALNPNIAAEIMIRGMSEGWFTGVTLEHYFPVDRPQASDWVNARRIINGLDCAAKIAGYAVHFRDALVAAGYVPTDAPAVHGEPSPAAAPPSDLSTVEGVQRALNALGFHVVVDGEWGPETEAAVKGFQFRERLVTDGDAGPLTKAALAKALAK